MRNQSEKLISEINSFVNAADFTKGYHYLIRIKNIDTQNKIGMKSVYPHIFNRRYYLDGYVIRTIGINRYRDWILIL